MPKQYSFSPKTAKKTKVGENTTGSNTSLGSGSVGGQVTWSLSEQDIKDAMNCPIPECKVNASKINYKELEDYPIKPLNHKDGMMFITNPKGILEGLCDLIITKDYGTLQEIQEKTSYLTRVARDIKEKINGEQETERNQSI